MTAIRSPVVVVLSTLLIASPATAQFMKPTWTLVPQDKWQERDAENISQTNSSPVIAAPQHQDGSVTSPIPPLTTTQPIWPSPSLNPGVPSAFLASWGDVFAIGSAASAGNERPVADGSFAAGFGLGDSVRGIAIEISGGCGSVKNLCSNGGFGLRVGRVVVNEPNRRIALTGSWQNGVQWGNEGTQDNIYSTTVSYAIPLQPPGSRFGQTLQINAGVGNSSFAPYVAAGSESKIGGFGSIGVELSPAVGVSAGWSGRGINAQISYTPLRDFPVTLNLLGVDLFNQTPAGTVGVFTVSWRTNFATPNFNTSGNF